MTFAFFGLVVTLTVIFWVHWGMRALGILFIVISAATYADRYRLAVGESFLATMDVLSILMLLAWIVRGQNIKRGSFRLCPSALTVTTVLVAWCLVSSARGLRVYENRVLDVSRDARILLSLIVPILVGAYVIRSKDLVRDLADVLIPAGAAIVSAGAIFLITNEASIADLPRDPALPYFILPIVATFITLFWSDLAKRGWSRLACGVVFAASTIMTLLSFTRGVYIQSVILAVCTLIYNSWVQRRWGVARTVVFVAATAALIWVVSTAVQATWDFESVSAIWARAASVRDYATDTSFQTRVIEAQFGIEDWTNDLLLGHGAGFLTTAMGPNGFTPSLFQHNTILYFGIKYGAVGVALITMLFILFIFEGRRGIKGPDESRCHGFLRIAILTAVVCESISAGLNFPPKNVLFGALMGVSLARPRLRRTTKATVRMGNVEAGLGCTRGRCLPQHDFVGH